MLFERVRDVAARVAGSQTSLAERLGLSQSRFQGYLNPKREDHLWPLLPRILEEFPQVSRGWLYFGEGEMLTGGGRQDPVEPAEASLDIAERLRLFADRIGLSGAKLAESAGITRQAWSGYVNRGSEPSLAVLAKWIAEYKLNVNWLLTGEGEMLLDSAAGIPAGQLTDPVAQRVQIVVASMRANGAAPEEIRGAIREALTGEPQAKAAAASDDEATGEMLKAGNGR